MEADKFTAETGSNLSSSVQQLKLSKHYREQDDYTNIWNGQGESNLHLCTVNKNSHMPKIVEHYQFISYFMVSPSMINWWVLDSSLDSNIARGMQAILGQAWVSTQDLHSVTCNVYTKMYNVSQYEANGHMVLYMVHTNRAHVPAAEHVAADVGLLILNHSIPMQDHFTFEFSTQIPPSYYIW